MDESRRDGAFYGSRRGGALYGLCRGGALVSGVVRLRRSSDVRATIRSGASAGGPGAVVHARRRGDDDPSRMTVVAGRRLGNAVTRNRAKRRLRAAVRDAPVRRGFDVVLVARPGAVSADYGTLSRTLAASVERALARSEGSR